VSQGIFVCFWIHHYEKENDNKCVAKSKLSNLDWEQKNLGVPLTYHYEKKTMLSGELVMVLLKAVIMRFVAW
jgi:hypothetical protein